MSLAEIMAMALIIRALAADDCAFFQRSGRSTPKRSSSSPGGFKYQTAGFIWVKTTPNARVIMLDGKGLHRGMGNGHTLQH